MPTASPSPPPAPAAGTTQPPTAGEPTGPDWERKFKGLQSVYQQLQEQHTALGQEKVTLTASLAEIQGQLNATKQEFDLLKTKSTDKEDELTAALTQLGDYKLLERKLTLLRQQAPQLLQFEQFLIVDVPDDLLDTYPDDMTDDQRKRLDESITQAITAFSQVMQSYVDQQVRAVHAGATPPTSPPRPTEPSLDELYQKVVESAGTPEYSKLMALYVKAAEKQDGGKDMEGLWRPTKPTIEMPMP
jgi:hypothetical protein